MHFLWIFLCKHVILQNWRFIDFHWFKFFLLELFNLQLCLFFFTGKHHRWSLFLIKLQTWRPAKRLQHRCFPVRIAKFLRTPFLQSTSGGLQRYLTFFLTDWRHMNRKNTVEISSIYWNVLLFIFLINFFIPPRPVEAVIWENFVPAKRDPGCAKEGSVLPGWSVLHEIAGCNLWRVYNTAGIPAKRDRISSRLTRIIWSPT